MNKEEIYKELNNCKYRFRSYIYSYTDRKMQYKDNQRFYSEFEKIVNQMISGEDRKLILFNKRILNILKTKAKQILFKDVLKEKRDFYIKACQEQGKIKELKNELKFYYYKNKELNEKNEIKTLNEVINHLLSNGWTKNHIIDILEKNK